MGWALKAKSQTVIEELTGRTWSLSQSTRHALRTKTTANKSAPLYGRLRVGGLGDLVPGYEHWYRDQIHLGYAQNIVGGNYLLHQYVLLITLADFYYSPFWVQVVSFNKELHCLAIYRGILSLQY